MKKRMPAIILLLSITLSLTGCFGSSEPTDPVYTDEEIWARCVESVEAYFNSDTIHISEDIIWSLGETEFHIESTLWGHGENYYAEYIQNEEYKFCRFQMNGNLYAKYNDGNWIMADTDSADTFAYRNTDLDSTNTPAISWEITDDQIRVTHCVSEPQSGDEETGTPLTSTYVFDLEWKLIQVDTFLKEPTTDAIGETVTSEVRRTIICHDTDEASVNEILDRVHSQVTTDN